MNHLGGYIPGGDPATHYPDLWDWLVKKLHVATVLDVGCGDGQAISYFRDELGCRVMGVDGVAQDDRDIVEHDYTLGPLDLRKQFDLAWSCEFVEHVEEQFIPNFIESFRAAKYVLLTHAGPGQDGHHHVNCLVEGTIASSPKIENAFRRWYSGDVVTLVTTDGDELTVTPNHPIATPTGWSPAGQLQEGDDLVGGSLTDWVPRGMMPNPYKAPTMIEEIFAALEKMLPTGVFSVPSTTKEFHGDGRDGKVDVVGADGLLGFRENSFGLEHCLKKSFDRRSMGPSRLTSKSPLGFHSLTIDGAASLLVQSLHRRKSLRLRDAAPSSSHDFRAAQNGMTMTLNNPLRHAGGNVASLTHRGEVLRFNPRDQNILFVDMDAAALGLGSDRDSPTNNVSARIPVVDMSFDGELGKRFSSKVTLKKLARIHRSEYVGHVYNLSTPDHAYWANGLIVHNCRVDEYWKGVMAGSGFRCDANLTAITRSISGLNENPYNHYYRSGLAFVNMRRPSASAV